MERKLYRSSQNKVLAGVCGGIGEYFGVDPVIIRLLVVVFTLAMGAGILAYIIAAIIIPSDKLENSKDVYRENYEAEGSKKDYRSDYPEESSKNNRKSALAIGLIFIAIGGLIFFRYYVSWIPSQLILAVLIILVGIFIIANRR